MSQETVEELSWNMWALIYAHAADFDGFNNDNLDVGGDQFGVDTDNTADQVNLASGLGGTQINGELSKMLWQRATQVGPACFNLQLG